MFSRLWKHLTSRAKSKGAGSMRAALAASLALAKREQAIREGEERKWIVSTEPGIATLHHGFRRRVEHLIEHCVAHYPCRHNPVLWRILIRSAYLKKDFQRCTALFYRAVRDCPWSKVNCITLLYLIKSVIQLK